MQNVNWFLFLSVLVCTLAWADDCSQAETPFQQSLHQSGAAREASLQRALKVCPDHAGALNNLAVIREAQGRLAEARELLEHAAFVDRELPEVQASLGDVYVQLGKKQKARRAYGRFLELVERAKRAGQRGGFVTAEAEYRQRLAALAGTADGAASGPEPVISSERIVTALKQKKVRALGQCGKKNARINVPIQFDYDSDRVRPESHEQLKQIAIALAVPVLSRSQIRIEGHTDSTGDAAYNQALSERRATAVREFLYQRHAVPRHRFEVVGFGESQPAQGNDTEPGRAANRRVTLVNIDGC